MFVLVFLKLLDAHLVPSATSSESKVFYLKMKGDYHRYMAEFKVGAERKEAAEDTMLAYKAAQRQEELVYIVTYDILFGQATLLAGDAEKFLMIRKAALQSALARLLVRKKVSGIE
ncbi:hypothetical protein ACHQM5_028531 [Ranunculus cassubicifolius]